MMSSSDSAMPRRRVAVIGGGITGCAVARQLLELDNNSNIDVTVLDWGRAVGGRASHRYRPEASTADPDKMLTLHFDHGAQFFHANNDAFLDMVRPAVQQWRPKLGWLNSETGKFTTSSETSNDGDSGFFGACNASLDDHRYVGVGGMNALSNEMLRGAKVIAPDRIKILEGTRVARLERIASRWKLYGDGLGHEQANAQALVDSKERKLGEFDELVITDHMAAAMPSWHPCHITGLDERVPELVSSVREAMAWEETTRRFRTVKSLFSCLVALEGTTDLAFDAASIRDNDILQWICCQESRPHEMDSATSSLERWVLVSQPEFAARCLENEGMSRAPSDSKKQVEYNPQSDEYLRADPADQMVQAFMDLVERVGSNSGSKSAPKVVFRKCQRWGAAFTSCSTGTAHQHGLTKVLKAHEETDSITLCGDYIADLMTQGEDRVNTVPAPGSFTIQDAALSGIDAAGRIAARLE